MKKLLNTLYVTQPTSYLYKDGQNVVVSVEQKDLLRVPIINLESIVAFGYAGCSPGLMRLCVDNGVSLYFFTPNGKYIARIQGEIKGNVILRKKQYDVSKSDIESLNIAKTIIASKIYNQRGILMRYQRDYGRDEDVSEVINGLLKMQSSSLKANSKDSLRGIEGMAASAYFSVFAKLITQQKSNFLFEGRNRRPARDEVNAMLSFSYTILANEITSALESVGMDPYLGVFHVVRPGRTSLSLDILEEFRAYLCDRFVLSLINRKQIQPNDFLYQGTEGIVLTDKGRKKFISAWQTRKQEEIIHPYLEEKVKIGLLPFVQAKLLASHLRGDLDAYPPFLVK